MHASNDLTKQESIVLALVAQGKRNADIAQELYLSVRTVESHLYTIFQKLRVSSRTEAAFYAFQSGLLSKSKFMGITDDSQRTTRAGLHSAEPFFRRSPSSVEGARLSPTSNRESQ